MNFSSLVVPRRAYSGVDSMAVAVSYTHLFIDCLKNGTPPPIDVYDAAVWMSITCLSEESIATGSNPVAVPDFTNGKWVEPRVSEKGKYSLD